MNSFMFVVVTNLISKYVSFFTEKCSYYLQKGSYLKLHTVRVAYKISLPNKSILQTIQFALIVQNLLIWSPYKGADPTQQLMDMPNGSGIDYFNIPSTKFFIFNIAIIF